MSIDYAALWMLVVMNTMAILLLVRQVATMPQFTRRTGPKAGTPVDDWSLESVHGGIKHSADLPDAYTLLFVASTCGPCHALFAEMRRVGRPGGLLYVVGQGDAEAMSKEAESEQGPLFDLFLRGGRGEVYQKLGIPGTPWAVAVKGGRVESTGPASTAEQLSRVCQAAMGTRDLEASIV